MSKIIHVVSHRARLVWQCSGQSCPLSSSSTDVASESPSKDISTTGPSMPSTSVAAEQFCPGITLLASWSLQKLNWRLGLPLVVLSYETTGYGYPVRAPVPAISSHFFPIRLRFRIRPNIQPDAGYIVRRISQIILWVQHSAMNHIICSISLVVGCWIRIRYFKF